MKENNFIKKVAVIIVLLVLFNTSFVAAFPLNSVKANMAAPFGYGSSGGNFIVNPKNVLEVNKENIVFEIGGITIENGSSYEEPQDISAHITYQIVNSGDDAEFTFVFPAINPVKTYKDKYNFNVTSQGKEIPYEAKNTYELGNLFKDKAAYTKIEELMSYNDRIYFDPVTDKSYLPSYRMGRLEKVFFVFNIFLKKGITTEVKINFKSYAGFDAKRYYRRIYHYFYLLNVKDFYKKFENVKISIVYPKNYILKTNFTGNITESSNKKILTIVPKGNFGNLSFSYMDGKISKVGIFFYKHFPFFYGESFGYLLMFIMLAFMLAFIISIIYRMIKSYILSKNEER